MKRTAKVTARFSDDEKFLLAQVAARLQRTSSDTIRLLVSAKARELQIEVQSSKFYRKESSEEQLIEDNK